MNQFIRKIDKNKKILSIFIFFLIIQIALVIYTFDYKEHGDILEEIVKYRLIVVTSFLIIPLNILLLKNKPSRLIEFLVIPSLLANILIVGLFLLTLVWLSGVFCPDCIY